MHAQMKHIHSLALLQDLIPTLVAEVVILFYNTYVYDRKIDRNFIL